MTTYYKIVFDKLHSYVGDDVTKWATLQDDVSAGDIVIDNGKEYEVTRVNPIPHKRQRIVTEEVRIVDLKEI